MLHKPIRLRFFNGSERVITTNIVCYLNLIGDETCTFIVFSLHESTIGAKND